MSDLVATEAEARELTERVRSALDRVSTAWAELGERITEAYDRRADLALGYSSWAEYAEAELKPTSAIAAEVRRELVSMLAAKGMSTRAIAPTVGVDPATVSRDRHVLHDATPEAEFDPVSADAVAMGTLDEDEFEDVITQARADGDLSREHMADLARERHPEPASSTITGLDGKTYPRPTPAPKPTRRPITDAFWSALYDLNKKAEALQRLVEDDRFDRNRDSIATRNLPQMRQTASTVASVLAAIENQG